MALVRIESFCKSSGVTTQQKKADLKLCKLLSSLINENYGNIFANNKRIFRHNSLTKLLRIM